MAHWFKRVATIIAVVLAVWMLLVGLLWLGQRRLIYLPAHHVPEPPADVTVVTAETVDGISHRLWVVPAEGEPLARVVVFNGNAGNKSHRLPLARNLAAEGLEVVLFDYRGYGDTEGSPSEDGLYEDAAAVVDAPFGGDLPMVYFGESIGAAVATGLSAEHAPAALVLRSPFTSLGDVAGVHYPFVPTGLLRDRFEVEDVIGSIDAPVLIVAGTEDSIVPTRLSRRVYEAASEPKHLIEMEGFGHNDPGLTSGREMIEMVARWIGEAVD